MKAKLIINKMAGKPSSTMEWIFRRFKSTSKRLKKFDEAIELVTKKCEKANIKLDVEFTKYPKHAREIAEAARNKYDLIIVAGGDGTLNEVVNGIARSRTTLAIIPLGTCNLLALALGIPLNIKKAVDLITKGERIKIDIGCAKSRGLIRYFTLGLSVGFDAHIVKNTNVNMRKRIGLVAYVYSALRHLVLYKWHSFYAKHETLSRGYFLVAANSKFMGCGYHASEAASMTDGFIDLIVVNDRGWLNMAKLLFSFYKGDFSKSLKRDYYQVKKVFIHGADVPFQVDGEVIGTIPVTVSVEPKALNVIAIKKWKDGSYKGCPKNGS